MKRTLVTGAAGFTGRYVGPVLSSRGHEVHGLVHRHDSVPIPGFATVHEGDLTDFSAVRRITREVQPDHVIHLAAIAFVAHSDVREMYDVNVVGARQLLEALADLPKPPRSIILASSANIYGNAYSGVLTEDLRPAPANDYGVTKVAMEYVASIYASKLPLIIARPFNYTGRGQGTHFIIPKIVGAARHRASVIELGNIAVARDFCDVRTVADAYTRLIDAPAAIGETVNVCSGRAISVKEALDLVMDLSGHQFEVRVNPDFVRANDVLSLCGSCAKIESIIGPLRRISLEDTLRWMLDD